MDKRLALVIVWMGVIFAGSSIPGQELQGISTPDYILHTAEYAVLGALLGWWCIFRNRAVSPDPSLFPYPCLILSVLAGSIYGIIDELHQGLVPGRYMDPRDWAADTVGTFMGAFIVLLMFYCYLKRQNAEKPSAAP